MTLMDVPAASRDLLEGCLEMPCLDCCGNEKFNNFHVTRQNQALTCNWWEQRHMHKDSQVSVSSIQPEYFAEIVTGPLWIYEVVSVYYTEFLGIVDGLMLMSSLSLLLKKN